MHHKTIGLTEFILSEEQKNPTATGSLTNLLIQIEYAGKTIASHIKKAGLVDILGKTGSVNTYQDEVIELDRFSNSLLVDTLAASGEVFAVASEELEDFHKVDTHTGDYVVCIDPLDGSANTEANITVGTIFSLYRKTDPLLQSGNEQVAAGYILYGTSVMFVYTTGNGVNGFTLDPSVGSFLLSHPAMRIPDYAPIYSINDAYWPQLDKTTQNFIMTMRKQEGVKSRYVGSMVADVHRTLIKGGIFLTPSTTDFPKGKLRLLFEVNPLSFIIEQAGGKATTGKKDPLTIHPSSLHDRAPIILGSPKNVQEYLSHL